MNGKRTTQPIQPQQAPAPVPPGGGETNSQYKTVAILGYILPFLFFIPLLSEAKDNKYAKYHANQQLNLLLWWVIGNVLAAALMFVLIGMLLYPIVYGGGVIFLVMGVINAANGEMKPLPLIGKIELLK